MDRSKHLEFCTKCTKQKFDRNNGVICGLTNQIADFENKCENFEIDKLIIEKHTESQAKEKKSKMSFGFSPKQIDNLPNTDLSKEQLFVLAYEAANDLNWDIGNLSESGFIAYTKFSFSSWSEEVQIKIEVGNINIKSECTGSQIIDWGKNRKNIDSFFNSFNKIKNDHDNLNIEERYIEISQEFVIPEDDIINPPFGKEEKVSGLLSLIIPTEGYFITPIVLNLNIVIFIIMAISGVNIMLPDNESLLLWGANFRPVTLDGEWWRLISSCFLHIGIFHLFMNMYALLYIGLLLEPFLGKSRFISAYLITGTAGSAASLFWNELTISAGASGAIFGMYGVFLAMLTTNLIEKSARKALITSIAVFVGFNLLNGLKGGIDNAAHIGGLVSGLIVGYSFYPSLVKPNIPKLKFGTIGLLSLLILTSSFIVLSTTSLSDISKYEIEMEQFGLLEEKALRIYKLPETTSDEEYLLEIQNTGIPNWKLIIQLLESFDQFDLPTALHDRNSKLMEYCDLRLKSYELIYKGISEKTEIYQAEIESYYNGVDSILNELK